MNQPHTLPTSVNLHLWKRCNERCLYCYATFDDDPLLQSVRTGLPESDARRILSALRAEGVEKITFVGGEPTLCPYLPRLLQFARQLGFVVMLVTNGKRLRRVLAEAPGCIDWVGLSVDSAVEATQALLGRGHGSYVDESIELFDLLREAGIRTKLNTVVTSLNCEDDMSAYVLRTRPDRWKIFQVLPVQGQNDGRIEPLLITREQFDAFVERHRWLTAHGIVLAAESNDDMTGSYAMIDPAGRFFDNSAGRHTYSRRILEVGVASAFNEVKFDRARFTARGGVYDWGGPPVTPLTVSARS